MASIEDLASKLTAAGFPCTPDRGDPDIEEIDVGVESSSLDDATCSGGGEDLQLSTFKDSGAVRKDVALMKGMGCMFGSAFGLSEFDWAQGQNWIVVTTTATGAGQIAEKLGGQANHHKCEGQ